MDVDFILALAKAAVGAPEPEPEPGSPPDSRAMRLRLSLSREVVCHQDRSIGIGGVSWQASLAISHSMDSDARLFPTWSGLRVLELGCGAALCGLTAWRLGAEAVVLTDAAHCEPLVQSSAISTREAGTPPSGTVVYSKLRWGDPVPVEAAGEFDVVLGSDLTYNTEDHGPLLSTLVEVCRRGRLRTRVVLAHQCRPPSTEVVRARIHGNTLICRGSFSTHMSCACSASRLKTLRLWIVHAGWPTAEIHRERPRSRVSSCTRTNRTACPRL
jgi:predicted nicotinamide N-methyase